MEFCVDVYGYDPLLSNEEIEGFCVNALDNLDVKLKMDGVIVAVAHDEFKKNPFLAQVLSLERKYVDVRGIFDEAAAKWKGVFFIGGCEKVKYEVQRYIW